MLTKPAWDQGGDQRSIVVIGVLSNTLWELPETILTRLNGCETIFGTPERLDGLIHRDGSFQGRCLEFPSPLSALIDHIKGVPGSVGILASGDPGFFGITRMLRQHFEATDLEIVPAPSSIAVAFAKVGLPWDDAMVVSLHGRDSRDILSSLLSSTPPPCVAFLHDTAITPEVLAEKMVDTTWAWSRFIVAENLYCETERITQGSPSEVATGHFSSRSISIVISDPIDPSPTHLRNTTLTLSPHPNALSAFDDTSYLGDSDNYTKSSVRSVILAKLEVDTLPRGAKVLDVGSGSGRVGITIKSIRPDLRVTAIDRDPLRSEETARNARSHVCVIDVETIDAMAIEESLVRGCQAIYIGGGGIAVLRRMLELCEGFTPRLCATFASPERALAAGELLGNLELVHNTHLASFKGGSRLISANPVFIAWSS